MTYTKVPVSYINPGTGDIYENPMHQFLSSNKNPQAKSTYTIKKKNIDKEIKNTSKLRWLMRIYIE